MIVSGHPIAAYENLLSGLSGRPAHDADSNSQLTIKLFSQVQKTGSQDSVGSCSSLTNREGLTTLNKIENIMQEVMQANMEMHQLKRVPSSTHSSDTRINSGSSTPRSKPVASNFTLMTKSSDYPLQASTNPVRQISTSGNNSALSPRVHHKRSGTSHNSAAFFAPSMPTHPLNDNRFSMMSAGSGEADDRSSRANFSMTYNDDNIDNSSEKPVDYSQMYRESGSVYELPLTNSGISSSNYGSSALQRQHMNYGVSQLPAAFLHHDPAMLLQTSSGSFMDPSYFMDFDIPSLEQIKAKAMAEKPAVAQQAPRQAPRQRTAATSGSRAMPELSRIEDQHGEDQVKTFCTEGTPMNYLSTATSMNELNKIGEEAISEKDEHSVSSQPTSTQSQVNEDSTKLGNSSEAKQGLRGKVPTMITSAPKHQEEGEDEPPKTYATEDTPLTGISRVSSLSSLNSAIDAKGTSTNGMSRESVPAPLALPTQGGLERIHEDEVLSPSSHAKAPLLKTPLEQKSVSFDEHAHVQETPMMFSRASSLASLSSCDQQSIHSSVFSDYSRRASQVVSPSDLPDSPGGTTQHSPTTRRKIKERTELRKDAQTPPLVPTEQLSSTQYSQPPPDPASQNLASLLGLSGMFGSLSGLASLQGPEVSNELTNNYAQHLLDQYCQPTHQVSAHPQFQQAQYGTQHTPNLPQHIPKQMVTESLMTRTDALVQNAEALQAPARLIHNTSQLDRTRQQFANSDLTVTGNSSAQPKSLSEPSNLSEVAKGAPEMKRPGILRSTAPVIAPVSSSSMHSIQKASLSANSKVDQFLSDTVRTYAVEGTPGPNSTRSSLSALTFLDEPEVPLSTLTMLRSSMSKESIGTAAAMSSSLKPLDLSMKVKPAAEVVNDGSNEEPPPLPPKPASLGVKKKEQSDTTACASAASSTNQAADGAPAKVMERSRTVSESMNDSDSSSDGDDLMLQQCISSALPLPSNRGKLPKSSSDSQVTAAASRQVSKGVPRSKTTFGSKLRMPSKRILKSTQLAKQRQAPPIVSANSPTPDDDHFAEETVMAYCTEDTPYNKSTATSLSDLSVIDDELNELDKSDGETEAKPSEVVVKEATKQQACAGALSASDTSSDSDGDNLLSNAIFSAIPKKSCKLSQLEEPEQKDKGAGPSSEKPSLKYTSNELRATDVKFQTSADSIRNYATEGTPNNFSTSTSLSDLTIDSHYSTSRSTGSKPTSKQPVKSIANHSSPSRLPSLLPKRQGSATGPPSQTPLTRLPQASSSPMQRATHLPTSLLQKGPQSISNAQCKTPTAAGLMDNDEMKSFGVEGTPFNYSRRESLSSLSCDEEEEDGVNVTIIDRVTEAMQRRVQDGNQGKGSPVSQSTVGQSNSSHSSRKITGSEASAERVGFAVATHQRPTLVVTDGIIDRLNLPQSDGFQSRDEMTKTYTPIEGTPYCFSRNSPLSSLSSSCDSLPGAGMASIGQAHQAEGGVSDSSESDSEASQGSFTTSQTFLDQCISSALPKKPSMLPLATKTSKIYKGSNSTKPSGKPSTLKKQPPSPLPKPVHVKPSPVNLLPSSGEMVVSQRSSKGVSTDTSTDSVKSDHVSSSTATISTSPSSVSTVYKSTQERRLSAGERELRRRTYTVTTSEVQSAIALLTDTSNGPSIESNIEISGDEDEFEDVFLIENGELLKQDVNAILAAIEEAAKEPEDKFFNMVTLNLPAPPSCIVEDSSTAPELVSSVDEEDHGVANEGTGETPNKCGHRGPRITKPNINSAEPISDLEKSKAIRGCRKPLYPGRKLNTEGATKKAVSGVGAKSSLSRQSKIARAPESPFRKFNSKVKESHGPSKPTNSVKPVYSQRSQVISRSNNNIPQMNAKSSRISTPVKRNQTSAHQNSPNVASAKRVGKNTASDNDTAAAASQLGKTSTAALRSTSALRSVSCNSRNVTPPGPTQSSPKSAVRPSSLPRTKEKNAAGKLVSRVDSVGAASTSRDALGEMAAVKGREGKAVSPSAALHRAAGDGAMSSGCQKKRASTRNFAKPHQLPYLPPGSKQQTSSRITGLAKVKPSQMSSSKRAENGTTNSSGGNSLTGNSAYVSSISFREPRGEGNHCHKKSAALLPDSCKTESQGDSTDSERHSHSSADSSSASDRVSSTPIAVINSAPRLSAGVSAGSAPCITTSAVASVSTSSSHSVVSDLEQKLPDKNSAVVSPFMYKAQQRSATDTSHRQSVTGDRLGSYTSSGAELSDDDVFTSGYTPQAHFYGQDNKITVQLDIKPCITLSDVSQTLAGDKSPHQYQLSHYNLKPTYDANMTKTEMLLRRRSEILNRRQDSQSSRWQPSKTTDV
ncbi:serine-rich adhesin for platelets-like [Watersipora subatra]|uniref:serine-rich adhesin for platelets-like n=1 Tax=Watersipora subatra TaxID=2589382 RepID=UPI00355BD2DE